MAVPCVKGSAKNSDGFFFVRLKNRVALSGTAQTSKLFTDGFVPNTVQNQYA